MTFGNVRPTPATSLSRTEETVRESAPRWNRRGEPSVEFKRFVVGTWNEALNPNCA